MSSFTFLCTTQNILDNNIKDIQWPAQTKVNSNEDGYQAADETNKNGDNADGQQQHDGPYERGGMPIISDSLFSLVILLYVSVAFIFVFFMFCWRTGNSVPGVMDDKGIEQNLSCPLMSLGDIIGGKQQQEENTQSIMMNILNKEIEDDFNRR